MTFRGDQGIELDQTAEILEGRLRLIGIKTSISEVRNGAIAYYFLAPLLAILHGSPVAGSVLQSIQIIGSAILVFWYLRKKKYYRESWAALVILLFSYPLVLFSRQTLLAYYPLFFFTAIFITTLETAENYKPVLVLLTGFLIGLAMQIHYSAISAAIYLLFFGLTSIKRKLNFFVVLFLGFIFGFLPMIIFELRHDFFNLKMLLKMI